MQVTGLVPVQMPAWQVSVLVHGLPSVQAEPLTFAGFEQAPVAGLQVPASWHWSEAAQVTGLVPTQTPLWQTSVCVHGLPSLQALPSALFGCEQMPVTGSQEPAAWH